MRTVSRTTVLLITLATVASAAPAAAGPATAGQTTAAPATETAPTSRWRQLVTTGEGVSARSAPSAVGLGGSAYVFGGVFDDFATGQATFYNDLHRLDLDRREWSRLVPGGLALPPARAFAAAAAHPASNRLFVFGGSTFDVLGTVFEPFGDLWAYSVTANRWSRLASATPGPSPRSGATMWSVGNRLYLFGGIDATFTTHNELWYYDLTRHSWTLVPVSGAAPPPRHVAQAGATAFLGKLTLYGGEGLDPATGFITFNDTWEFDLVRGTWREAPTTVDPARNYGASAVVGSGLYVHGGDIPGGSEGCGAPFPQNATEELWRFDLVRRVWQKLTPGGDPLVRLKRHAAATVAGRMVIVAGWDFQCEGGTGPGQVWNLHTYTFTP